MSHCLSAIRARSSRGLCFEVNDNRVIYRLVSLCANRGVDEERSVPLELARPVVDVAENMQARLQVLKPLCESFAAQVLRGNSSGVPGMYFIKRPMGWPMSY